MRMCDPIYSMVEESWRRKRVNRPAIFTAVITPSVPSAPMNKCFKSYPASPAQSVSLYSFGVKGDVGVVG